jgi:hypothetical protein
MWVATIAVGASRRIAVSAPVDTSNFQYFSTMGGMPRYWLRVVRTLSSTFGNAANVAA